MSDSLRGTSADLNTAPAAHGKSPKRGRRWLLGVGLAVLIGVLAVFASQQGDGGGATGPLNAIAAAAVKTQHEGGGRAVVQGVISKSGSSKPLGLTGQVVYTDSGLARGHLSTSDPDSGKPVKFELVQDGTEAYMRSSAFGTLPDGKEWVGIDYSLGDELDTSVPAGGDVMGELALLETATGGVEKVGTEKVRGADHALPRQDQRRRERRAVAGDGRGGNRRLARRGGFPGAG